MYCKILLRVQVSRQLEIHAFTKTWFRTKIEITQLFLSYYLHVGYNTQQLYPNYYSALLYLVIWSLVYISINCTRALHPRDLTNKNHHVTSYLWSATLTGTTPSLH